MSTSRLRPSPAMVVACTSLVLSMGGVGYAATGGTFVLGSANKAGDPTSLTSKSTTDSTLVVNNKGGGSAATFKTQDGAPPFLVNQETKVDKLNADLLDGLDSTSFVQAGDEVPAASVFSNQAAPSPNISTFHPQAAGETFDHGGLWDPGVPGRFTVPRSGTYVVTATVVWDANNNGYRRIDLETDKGSIGTAGGPPLPSPAYTTQNVSGIASLAAGESVWVTSLQGSGGTLNVRLARFQIAYVGG